MEKDVDTITKKVEKQVKKIKKNEKDVEKGIIALANRVSILENYLLLKLYSILVVKFCKLNISLLRIPTGGRLISWLFTQRSHRVELGIS